jgi:hypothetical protein
MEETPGAAELLAQLGLVADEQDLALVRAAAVQEAIRLRHPTLLRGHLLTVLVRSGADPELLRGLGIEPGTTAVQLADLVRAEADAEAGSSAAAPEAPVKGRTCPECGEVGPPRFESRRVPNPDGGRGSTTARIALCGACGAPIGPG